MQVTTPEQRERLLKAGLSYYSCDAGRVTGGTDNPGGWQEMKNIREAEWWNRTVMTSDGQRLERGVVAEYGWTAEALLEMLPRQFHFPCFKPGEYAFREVVNEQGGIWKIRYCFPPAYELYRCYGETLVDACVKTIEALTALGYLPYTPPKGDLLKGNVYEWTIKK